MTRQTRSRGTASSDVFLAAAGTIVYALMSFRLWGPTVFPSKLPPKVDACKSNLKEIGFALEMYSSDHGALPSKLESLAPAYLKEIPRCPKAGRDTYSASYSKVTFEGFPQVNCWRHGQRGACGDEVLRLLAELSTFYVGHGRWPLELSEMKLPGSMTTCPYTTDPFAYSRSVEVFEISCAGRNHKESSCPTDFPRYTLADGVTERP